jgi:hypothetical protein
MISIIHPFMREKCMSLRKLVLIGSLATVLGGCVVAPAPHAHRGGYYDDNNYYSDDDYYDYHATPSYEGYFYVRVIFIGNIPYYVDDDRHVRPIPRHLHDHFRKSPFRNRDRHAPYFSRDREVRDGYDMSRVVYFNNVPHYVENGRVARPLPNHMHDRFRAAPFGRDNDRSNDGRFTPDRRNEPPSYGRDRDRRESPVYGRERDPAYGREQERMTPPPFDRDRDRDQRGNNDPRQYDEPRFRESPFRENGAEVRMNGRNSPQPLPPVHEERGNPQPDQRGSDGPRGNGPASNDRGRDDDRQGAPARRKEPRPDRRSRGDDEDDKENGAKRERGSPFR